MSSFKKFYMLEQYQAWVSKLTQFQDDSINWNELNFRAPAFLKKFEVNVDSLEKSLKDFSSNNFHRIEIYGE